MARPKKAIVEYFPHMVNHGKTMFTIESKYGNDGYSFYFKMLEMLGASEHHYLDCNNTETWEFMLAKTHLKEEIANEILDKLAKLDSIDSKLWSIRVIRSNNFIQNLDAVYKRRSINVINNDDLYSLCIQKLPLSGFIDNICPQSKVEYSKVEESIFKPTQEQIEKFNKFKEYIHQETVYSRIAMNLQIKPNEILHCVNEFTDTCYGSIIEQKHVIGLEQYFINWVKMPGKVLECMNNQHRKNGKK